MAPLDDATLVEVRLASPAELARYEQALDISLRESFGGVSFSDGKGHILISFTADEYDEYLAYLRDHPLLQPVSDSEEQLPWPRVLVSFRSERALFDPDAGISPDAIFELCDAEADDRRLWGFDMLGLLWRDHLVAPGRIPEIETARRSEARTQKYEMFFNYMYSDFQQAVPAGRPVTLLPLPGDLCISFYRFNYPLPASVGRPMRVREDLINGAIGPVPRLLSPEDQKSN